MPQPLSIFALFAIFAAPFALHGASSPTQEQEYQQVRKIALRDARVRAAYEEADQRLEAKIVQIDPALKGYKAGGGGWHSPQAEAKPAPSHEHHAQPAAPKAAAPKANGATHVVAKGETLGSIAAKYGVTVAALKSANHIQDERKLRAGQTITIPKHIIE